MRLSATEHAWFKLGDELTATERSVCDSAMQDIQFSARAHGIPLRQDDSAAAFESAIIRYIIESRRTN